MSGGNASQPQPRGLGDGRKGLPGARRSGPLRSPLPRRPKSIILPPEILNAEIGDSPAWQSPGAPATQCQSKGCGCEGRAAAPARAEGVKASGVGDFSWCPSHSGANAPFGNRDLQSLAELLPQAGQDADHGPASPASHRGYKGFNLGRTTVPVLALHLKTQLRARVQTQPQDQIPGGQD